MVLLKGVAVTVRVHGEPLEEHMDEENGDTNSRMVNRYIVSEAGEPFTLNINCKKTYFKGFSNFSATYQVDGIVIKKFYVLHGKDGISGRKRPTVVTGPVECVGGLWYSRQLHFTNLQITDDKAVPSQETKDRVQSLGLISLQLWRVKNMRESDSEPLSDHGRHLSEASPVSEKALKGQAIDSSARAGKARRGLKPSVLDCDFVDHEDKPYTIFNFRYRSRKALQSMCIIPRSPTPLALEDRPRDTLSRDELLELLARRDKQSTMPPPKAETKSEADQVKRERDEEIDEILASARPAKSRRVGPIEVIDLLDD